MRVPAPSLSTLIESKVTLAVSLLEKTLKHRTQKAKTHTTLIIEGWNDGPHTHRAIADYLIGLRANALTTALEIRAQLEDTKEDLFELKSNIYTITGSDKNPLTEDQINKERNPWIAEGIWHLCLHVAHIKPSLHPPGTIQALNPVHVLAKDHGLDVLAIYLNNNEAGVSLVETKAYENDPSKAVTDATEYFKKADNGELDLRVRQAVSAIRPSLDKSKQPLISGSFWKRSRSYLANPHYDASVPVDWTNTRSSFAAFEIGKENILIMPNAVSGFRSFFNNISQEMKSFADSL